MSAAKLALVAGLVAISLSACGATTKPEAGTIKAASVNRKGIDDPRTTHVKCLEAERIPVTEFSRTWLQIGAKPTGPTVHFEPTPGAAQEAQINGSVQSAEVIGAALLYPNQASDSLLQKVEDCVAKGVTG
ncbi:MAG TPA: hypothetical protein VN880_14110 [Solirubrobacteraceae bacterium]|jgi:hypothetical protein|nr:hypothetical protein [Solirubrobacteraceae bacterium]